MRTSRALVLAVVPIAVLAAFVGVAVGRTVAASSVSGDSVERVTVVRGTEIFHSSGTAYAEVTGATARITIPAGHRSFLVARFTAQQECTVGDGSPNGSCMARILMGSGELLPGSGGTIIDSVQQGVGAGTRSAALDRSSAPLGPGTYTVHVQAKVTSALMILEITDWHLTVERVDVP